MNQIYSNGLKFIFLGHSCFRVIHGETIITKVHSQTLMAMKSGCKMYTHKCYVTLEWPLMLHFKHVLPTICAMCPQKIITRAKVPLKCNFANKSALFPQAAPCPFQSWAEHCMSTENYGLAIGGVACFQVYYGITKYTQYNISYAYILVIFTSPL